MYALAINGSPRKGGNTHLLLDHVLQPLRENGWETELVDVGNIHGCRACFGCAERQDKRCVFDKDGFNALFANMLRADALILGSPCYFTDVTAELKALIDRAGFVAQANGQLFKGKIGAGVVAVRRGGATHAFDSINHLFLMSRMVVPGSTYWNMGYGLGKGDVLRDDEGLANMHHLGRMIDWLGKALADRQASFPS